jgi:hypothetical protein
MVVNINSETEHAKKMRVRTLNQSESMQMCIGGAPAIIDRSTTVAVPDRCVLVDEEEARRQTVLDLPDQ